MGTIKIMFYTYFRLLDNVIPDNTACTESDIIKQAYKSYCLTENCHQVPITTLGKILLKLFPKSEGIVRRSKTTSKHIRVYKGIRLQKENENQAELFVFSTLHIVPPGSFLM